MPQAEDHAVALLAHQLEEVSLSSCHSVEHTFINISLAVQQTPQVAEGLVGDVLGVDIHALPLPGQKVCGVDGPRTAAICHIKGVPSTQPTKA